MDPIYLISLATAILVSIASALLYIWVGRKNEQVRKPQMPARPDRYSRHEEEKQPTKESFTPAATEHTSQYSKDAPAEKSEMRGSTE